MNNIPECRFKERVKGVNELLGKPTVTRQYCQVAALQRRERISEQPAAQGRDVLPFTSERGLETMTHTHTSALGIRDPKLFK